MNDLDIDENSLDWNLSLDANGSFQFDVICGAQAVSNMIRSKITFFPDYSIVDDSSISLSTRRQYLKAFLMQIDGVTDVDMSGFEPSVTNCNVLSRGTICPSINCENSVACTPTIGL